VDTLAVADWRMTLPRLRLPLLENQPVRSPCFSASSRGVYMRNMRIISAMPAVYLSVVRTTALAEDFDLYTLYTQAHRLHESRLAIPDSA
jgi:hypothetical protein